MTSRDTKAPTMLRRDKARPCDDFWHTLRIGFAVAVVLFLTLPLIFRLLTP